MTSGTRTKVAVQRSPPLRLLPHPESPIRESWRAWAQRQERPKAVDLFSGAGGLSLGLEQAGYVVILSVDHDPWALETHRHNFPGAALDLDLSNPERLRTLIRLLDGVDIDLIAGGPPCQPFSRAGRSKIRSLVADGRRPANDQRKDLWQSFLYVIETVRPKAVLMENVPDMALGDDLLTIRKIIQRLEAVGYEVEVALLDAWRYGVPQHRQRLILVAVQNGIAFDWPEEQPKVHLLDAIGDLPHLGGGTGSRDLKYSSRPKTKFQRAARAEMIGENSNIIWDHLTRAVRDDDREAFELMATGYRYSDLPKHLRRYRDDIFDDKYHRLQWNELSRSITAHIAKDGYWYIHPSESRTLTVREAARIQTFPDHFRFAGTRSHAFSQIGNAVPPALARAVAHSLLETTQKPMAPAQQRWSLKLAKIHNGLLAWANKDNKLNFWRHPGDPWAVLAATLLQSRPDMDDSVLRQFLCQFPTPEGVTAAAIRSFRNKQGSKRHTDGLQRLLAVARVLSKENQDWLGGDWLRVAKLTPNQDTWMRVVGLQQDAIYLSAGIIRVVSRLTGRQLENSKRLSDGKVAVARVLGINGKMPSITAALSAVSSDFCRPTQPTCGSCPLARLCATSDAAV